jgi:hypothetical protein
VSRWDRMSGPEKFIVWLTGGAMEAMEPDDIPVVFPQCPTCAGTQWAATGQPRNRFRRVGGPGRQTFHGYSAPQGQFITQRHACEACGFRADLIVLGSEGRGTSKRIIVDIY